METTGVRKREGGGNASEWKDKGEREDRGRGEGAGTGEGRRPDNNVIDTYL